MKKLFMILLAAALMTACLSLGACTNESAEYVSNDAEDLLQEDFGIAMKKGDAEIAAAVNAVVGEWLDNGNMQTYFEYFSDLADENKSPEAPSGLKLTWDLSNNTETLDMYTESGFAPYEFMHASGYPVADGSYSVAGLDVAIACEVAENLGCILVIHDVLFDDIITNLNATSGKALAAAGLTINEERMEQVDFSEIYSSSTLSIVCDKTADYHSLKELDGLKIGVQKGTSGDLLADKAKSEAGYSYENDEGETITVKLESAETEIVTFETYAAALAALKTGKIDVIFMDKVPSLLLLANL